MITRSCPMCKNTKSAGEFHRSKSTRDGMSTYCKVCTSEKDRSPRSRFSRTRCLARTREIHWGLTFEEYEPFLTADCHYCGWSTEGVASGIDRLNNDIGYVIGNCVPACAVCNSMKGNHFGHDEQMQLSAVIRKIRIDRKAAGLTQPEWAFPKFPRQHREIITNQHTKESK